MINVRIQESLQNSLSPKITVIGVGGAGGNAVNNMISTNLTGVDFLVCNTDSQALQGSLADNKIQLGTNVTGGLGAGSDPQIGAAAAEESINEVISEIQGSNMVFITCGMGGGTGTGAAPVIAAAAREQGILTVGVVTKPFHFEGGHRMRSAEAGIEEMQQYVDTLIVIPNQNLFRVASEKTTFAEAFKMADTVLQSGVRGVTDLMVMPGLINLDFADIKTVMQEMGKAMMGTGEATGDSRAIEAAESAINNPLLDDISMKGARGLIINVTGGMDMTLFEVDEACNRVRDEVDPDANIIFGSTFDENMEGEIRVSIVATGIDVEAKRNPITGSGFRGLNTQKTQTQTIERSLPKTTDTAVVAEQKPFIPPQAVTADLEAEVQDVPQQETLTQVAETAVTPDVKTVEQSYDASAFTNGDVKPAATPVDVSGPTAISPIQSQAADTTEKKKTPSLFERFTGGNQDQGDQTPVPATQPQMSSPLSSLRAEKPLAQGSLNIDAAATPKAASSSNPDDDLDIPAFLRRQVN